MVNTNQLDGNFIKRDDVQVTSVTGRGLLTSTDTGSGVFEISYNGSTGNDTVDYITYVKTKNPTALWACDIVSDGTMLDESGNGHHLQITNMFYQNPALCKGSFGSISGREESAPSVITGGSNEITSPVSGDMSITFWAKTFNSIDNSYYGYIFDREPSFSVDIPSGSGTGEMETRWVVPSFRGRTDSWLNQEGMVPVGSTFVDSTDVSRIDPTFVTLIYNSATEYVYSYANGILQSKWPLTDGTPASTTMRLFADKGGTYGTPHMIDTVALWDRILTPTEIMDLYHAGRLE